MKWLVSVPVRAWPLVKRGIVELCDEVITKLNEDAKVLASIRSDPRLKSDANVDAAVAATLARATVLAEAANAATQDGAVFVIEVESLSLLSVAIERARLLAPARHGGWFKDAANRAEDAELDFYEASPVDTLAALGNAAKTDGDGRVRLDL